MLSRYFSQDEVTHSDVAVRKHIDNTPDAEALEQLKITCRSADIVRDLLGHPMLVSSGYRSPKLNIAIGGSKTSSHMRGEALDFTCPGFGTTEEVFNFLRKSAIMFDQLILEFPDSASGGWVHIGYGDRMRGQCLVYDGQYRQV